MTLVRGIKVYRGGVLNQKGFGFLSGLLNVVKRGATALAPSLLNAGKQFVMNSLPKVGEEVVNMVTGKQKVKQGFKNILHRGIKPAAKNAMSDTLKHLVTSIKDPQPSKKRSNPSRPRTGNIKQRKKDIFDHGFGNDAS